MMPERRGLGLRGRLTLFFVAITVIPVLVAAVLFPTDANSRLRASQESSLRSFERAAAALVAADRARAGDLASDLAMALARDPARVLLGEPEGATAVEAFLEERAMEAVPSRADMVVILGPDGRLLGQRGIGTALADGNELGAEDVAAALQEGRGLPGALLEVRELVGAEPATVGWVVTALWTDQQLLHRLGIPIHSAVVSGDRVLAVSEDVTPAQVPVEVPRDSGVVRELHDDMEVVLAAQPLFDADAQDAPVELLVWDPQRPRQSPLIEALPVVLPTLILAAGLGYFLAASVAIPLRRAAEVARAVAAGDLTQHLQPAGGREVRELSVALNQMSAELARRMTELHEREQQLRENLARLGETLSSSLDANRTLSVVVDTARDTLGADRALLAVFTPERDALYTKVGRGLDGAGPRLRLGEGLIGTVAQRGLAVLVPGTPEAPQRVDAEPSAPSQLAVPMIVRGRVLGVLSLLRDGDEPYDEDDLETLRSFATQAAVAIENVLLHQEAQRLSVTDPLTGLWNFRYFQLQATREVEAAARSGRPVSLIVVDIDRFKQVNDRFGHQVGDEVLIEVARRLRDSTRAPDVVARYGGEEFVVLLPDTDLEGATTTAERIHAAVGSTPVTPDGASHAAAARQRAAAQPSHAAEQLTFPPLPTTCSVGVATLPVSGGTVAGLLRAADAAMYQAKQEGRNRVVVARG